MEIQGILNPTPTEESILETITNNSGEIKLKELENIFIFDPWDKSTFFKHLGQLHKNKKIIALDKTKKLTTKEHEVVFIKIAL